MARACEPGSFRWKRSIVFPLSPALFPDTLFQCFASPFRWLDKLLPFLVFIQNTGTSNHLFEAVDRAVDAFVIFYVNSNHIYLLLFVNFR